MLDLIYSLLYWIGRLPGADRLFSVIHLNVTRNVGACRQKQCKFFWATNEKLHKNLLAMGLH